MELSRLVRIACVLAIAISLESCTREPAKQSIRFVIFLVAVIFLAPAVSYPLKRRDSGLEIISLIVQILAYVIYESGISQDTDNRADLVFMYPAIALNAWIVFGNLGSSHVNGDTPDVIPGVSIPIDRYTCDTCGTKYAPDSLQANVSERHICGNCSQTA